MFCLAIMMFLVGITMVRITTEYGPENKRYNTVQSVVSYSFSLSLVIMAILLPILCECDIFRKSGPLPLITMSEPY